MSEEDKKVIEDLLNINPRNMSYKQLVSMQNGWWETLNLLSEQNKENKQLKEQLQQKENIINELEHDFESYELEYLQDTYQGSLADFIETELERIKELKGSESNE